MAQEMIYQFLHDFATMKSVTNHIIHRYLHNAYIIIIIGTGLVDPRQEGKSPATQV